MPTKKTRKPKAPQRLTINVTEEDIKKGIPGDPCNCPISRALKRGGATNTAVDVNYICWTSKGEHFVADTPSIAEAFVALFDQMEGKRGARALLRPFSFTIKQQRDDDTDQEIS